MAKMIYELTSQEWLQLSDEEKGAAVDTTNSELGWGVGLRRGWGTGPGREAEYRDFVVEAIRDGCRVPDAVVAQEPPFAAEHADRAMNAPRYEAAYAALGPNLDTSLVAGRGFSMRIADGTPVQPELRDEVGTAMATIEAALHINGDIWRKAGLTIVHIDKPLIGLPPASGCFMPEEMTITLVDPPEYENGALLQTLAHEVVHLLDCRKPGRWGHRPPGIHHSKTCVEAVVKDGDARLETELYRRALRSMNRKAPECARGCDCGIALSVAECGRLRPYFAQHELPHEVFARLGEQYIARHTLGAPKATLPIRDYRMGAFYWSREAFADLEQEVRDALRRRCSHWTARTWPVH